MRQLDDFLAPPRQDPRLAFENDFFRHAQASAFPWKLDRTRFGAKKNLITLKLELPDRAKTLEKKGFEALRRPSEFPEPAQALFGLGFGVLGKPTGWANQSNQRGWYGQAVQKPCKSY